MIVKSKIVLFDSNIKYVGSPLALLSITKLLDVNKYDIRIITRTEYPNYENEILRQCEGAICFGVTCISGTPIKTALKVSGMVKQNYPALPIIWGGWQAITLPDVTLENPNIDYLCIGQGERTFYEFVNMLETNDFSNIAKIAGLSYKNHGVVIHNLPRESEDLNLFPDFDLHLINWEKYLEVVDYGKRVLRIVTSYGCAYRCGFCCEPFNTKRRWRALSSERIMTFLRNLYKLVEFDGLVIVDSNFFTNENRVVDFCAGLIKNNFNIRLGAVNGRTNELSKYKETTWELLQRAGLYQILIGAESASNETLKLINKGATVEETIMVAQLCKKYNIQLVVSTILGLPIDSYFGGGKNEAFDQEFRELFMFYKDLQAIEPHTLLLAFVYTPLPSTPIYEKVINLGFIPPNTLEAWSDYELTDIHIDWVSKSNITKVQMLNFACGTMSVDFSYMIKALPLILKVIAIPIIAIAKCISGLRLKYNFLSFPIDMKSFYFGLKIFKKMNRVFRMVNIGD